MTIDFCDEIYTKLLIPGTTVDADPVDFKLALIFTKHLKPLYY